MTDQNDNLLKNLGFSQSIDQKRLDVLEKLAKEAQKHNMGY